MPVSTLVKMVEPQWRMEEVYSIQSLSKAKLDPTTIKFNNIGDPKNWCIKTFTDSSLTHGVKKVSVNGEMTCSSMLAKFVCGSWVEPFFWFLGKENGS